MLKYRNVHSYLSQGLESSSCNQRTTSHGELEEIKKSRTCVMRYRLNLDI